MEMIGSRRRNQPAPPWAIFEDLCDPHRQPIRPWLHLLDDEVEPTVVEFDLHAARGDTDLRWTLYVDEPVPDAALTGHMRKRLNQLINANLRYTFGQ
jgi:hypothetical protein